MGNGKGSSYRDQLMNVWSQTGEKPQELENLPELPQSCYMVWEWFLNLNESRSSNGFGFQPISYTEIYSFFKLKEVNPDHWEIDLIRRLDREVLAIYAKKAQADSKKKS